MRSQRNKILSVQQLDQTRDRLLASRAHAETLDFPLSPTMQLLVPALESMLQIVAYIEQQRDAGQSITPYTMKIFWNLSTRWPRC